MIVDPNTELLPEKEEQEVEQTSVDFNSLTQSLTEALSKKIDEALTPIKTEIDTLKDNMNKKYSIIKEKKKEVSMDAVKHEMRSFVDDGFIESLKSTGGFMSTPIELTKTK